MSLLERIHSPADLKQLDSSCLPDLAEELRQRVIEVTSCNGGHIGPNLGVVELTLALHRVFETPRDRFVFDVSHQGYIHKLLTGRQGPAFDKIRSSGGLSGFLCRNESEHDSYGAGHAGTALSAALGMAVARDRAGAKDEHVVAVIGDAALTCGITMEALNNLAVSTKRLVVILNDNKWSIAPNVGAIPRYLNELITNPIYNRIDSDLKAFFENVPGGQSVIEFGRRWKKETKDFFVSSSLFESFGLRYLGPIDGHNVELVQRYLEFSKTCHQPVLLHVITEKGRGYRTAIEQPEKFHGASPFDIETGKSKSKGAAPPKYQDVLGQSLIRAAKRDKRYVGITAAMPSGTGLNLLREAVPEQYYDVGIAEEHAVLFAAGMATRGLHPVCAIYSTFLQRAIDPIIHDVCLQNLPVTFAMDRAGLSPNDGPTHHGLFDFGYLRPVPNTIIMQPKDEDELCDMVHTCLQTESPTFVRYPRGSGEGVPIKDEPKTIPIGKAEVLREGGEVILWAVGPWVSEAIKMAAELEEAGIPTGVINARFVKPLDVDLLSRQARRARFFVSLEDHVVTGGLGSAILEALSDMDLAIPVERIGWPDAFVDHGSSVKDLRQRHGLGSPTLVRRILERYNSLIEADGESVLAR